MIDLSRPTEFHRLREAVRIAQHRLSPFRESRLDFIREYAGHHYGNDPTPEKVPTNFIELAVNIYTRALAAHAPQVLASTPVLQHKPLARKLELATNKVMEDICFESELIDTVMDALFCVGVLKVGLRDDGQDGQPYAQHVDFDDLIIDMGARRWDEVSFIGNRYRLPLEDVLANEAFDADVREALDRMDDPREMYNEVGDEMAQSIAMGEPQEGEEYEKHIDLIDLYLPREQLLVTYADEYENKPLAARPWRGSPRGPYHWLSFFRVPANIMPLAPVSVWYDLHLLANHLFRKIGRQAERQKTLGVAQQGSEVDGRRIRDAADGELVMVDNVGSVGQMSFGGVDNGTLAAFLQTKDQFNWFAGNLETMGGLGPQADTLGQEELLHSSASARLTDMQETVISFTKKAVQDLAGYVWNHPTRSYDVQYQHRHYTIPMSLTPGERQRVPLSAINVKIEPYSMQHRPPQARVRTLTQVFTQLVLPMLPMLEKQGIVPDLEGFLRTIGRLLHLDELEEVLMFTGDAPGMAEGGGEDRNRPRQAPNTTRTNVRVNRPGATRSGKDQVLSQILSGGNAQPADKASVFR